MSVRWQCQEMVLLWRSRLSTAALQFYLPIFIVGNTNPQVLCWSRPPYHRNGPLAIFCCHNIFGRYISGMLCVYSVACPDD